MSDRILVVEDETVLRENLCELLLEAGFAVDTAVDGAEALERVVASNYALVLTDIRMPRLDGLGLLERVVAECPQTVVLIMTAYASVESAVEALRLGAHDYLLKPIVFEELLQKVRNVLELRALKGEVSRLRRSLQQRLGFAGIVGDSAAMRAVFSLVDKVAAAPTTVLITGESGTGKELIARAVHERSASGEQEFIAVNVAAIPTALVESQLFGHERGAFTNAVSDREGLLRSARGGTVFLDEVGELSGDAQVKLLRALETREVVPVGADRAVKASFRLIAATNRALEQRVESGRFRQDLFYRLNVFRIELPPLRDRPEDITALVTHFSALHAQNLGRPPAAIDNAAMSLLRSYPWPGNVRELSNVIERAQLLADGEWVTPHELPPEIVGIDEKPLELKSALLAYERDHIARVLAQCGDDKPRAAEALGIHLATLYRRLGKPTEE